MRLKQKPKRPVRNKNKRVHISIKDCTVADFLQRLNFQNMESKIDLETLWFDYDYDYDTLEDIYVAFNRVETDCEFEDRLSLYRDKLKKWKAWHKANKPEIEAEMARREREAELKADKRRKKLTVQHKRIRTELEKLGGPV